MEEEAGTSRPPVDLVIHNAKIHTFDPQRPQAAFVAIGGGLVRAVGDEGDLSAFRRPGVRLVDCDGASVIPGFDDAHCHPIARAIGLVGVDCSRGSVHSLSEIRASIAAQAQRVPLGEWIRATGFDEARLAERRAPTRADLDAAAPEHPVVLVHATGQSCVLSSAALERVGLGRNRSDPAPSGVQTDPLTGEPTGLVVGRQPQIARAIPAPDPNEVERAMARVDAELLSQGVTSLQDVSWTNGPAQWQLWQRLVERERVTPRVSMFAGTESLERFRADGLATGTGDARLRIGAFKLALDESSGRPHPAQAEVNELALRAHEAGFQVALHVSDVRMLASALAAIAFVRGHSARPEPRFRLEHCSLCPPALLPKIRASGAIVVTQPAFLRHFGDAYLAEARPEQASWLCPLRSLRRAGVEVAFGSDAPLVSSDPLAGIRAAMLRRTEAGCLLGPAERLAALEAIEHYTLGGARAALAAGLRGTLQPGRLADLVVLSHDVSALDAEELAAVRVRRTLVGGRIVWEA